ncbi:unnamed protein product [Pocillopora meandrina]|uniref:Uncharacterized protein n=1 Tax=Pocillopora meandrina TaxID=46732 RepID=A0AAU9XZS7_9CNID|nr:unnamed protein product [Pocillopora meandrina]
MFSTNGISSAATLSMNNFKLRYILERASLRALSRKRVTTDAVIKEFVALDCINRNKVGISEGGIGVNQLSIFDLTLYCYITLQTIWLFFNILFIGVNSGISFCSPGTMLTYFKVYRIIRRYYSKIQGGGLFQNF